MEITQEQVLSALSFVIEPDLKKDIISLGFVSDIKIEGNKISCTVQASNPAMHNRKRIEDACDHQLKLKIGNEVETSVSIVAMNEDNQTDPQVRKVLPGVKHIIAVASGKGGVGKSTITSNIAAGLAKRGYKVGLIDADIYGPSVPIMFDVQLHKPGMKDINGKSYMTPVEAYGVKILSIGFFADTDQAIVWRGPMASKALDQMVKDVYWGDLDYMLIDLPPGTGDVHLSIVQAVPLSGAIVVSTPQQVALADARKGINMFQMDSIKVPVLGLVENMSYFTPAELPDNKYYIFGKDGAKELSEKMNTPLLAQIPLVQSIRESGDIGRPAVLQDNTASSKAFEALVDSVIKTMENK
ncbi:MAG: Mrp/NBP35 family ATP-binding protein [Salibacteraceae bacterium]|nr:Mrp/NBP35 family ATP-binding protein [Salibacteraceae bacterium]|tara:strand:- start:39908 stop:40972 length:1065 start_codon:yes stop_codon:yes gene_type:complete